MAQVTLKNIRIVFPRLAEPNEKGKYTLGVLIPIDSEAHRAFMAAVGEAWRAGRQKYGEQQFCPNPTRAQVYNRCYVKESGGIDSQGRAVPEWYDGHIGFTANAKKPVRVIDRRGNDIPRDSSDIYDGQLASVSLDISPVYQEGNPCVGRYLRAVLILGGGERIETGSGGSVDPRAEFADQIEPDAGADYDAFASLPY